MTSSWLRRLAWGAVVSAAGFSFTLVIGMGPRPLGWVLLTLLALSLAWLVLDTVDVERPQWRSGIPAPPPEAHEITHDRQLLDSHRDADTPSPALRDRLVALARARDEALSDPELAALATSSPRRLTPTEIDHYLTRIEALRDRP